MAQPSNRKEFRDYIIKRLGHPAVRVNVTEEQIQDRIDDALYLYRTYSPNAAEEQWITHIVTKEEAENNYIEITNKNIREISDVKSGNNGIFASSRFHSGSWEDIYSMLSVFDIVTYYNTMQTIELYNDVFGKHKNIYFKYNKFSNRLQINGLKEGQKIAIKAYKDVDTESNSELWNDNWLKDYATALVLYQWGRNLSKYSNIPLIGGQTVNGQDMMSEAQQKIDTLKEEIKNTQEPLMVTIA